MIFYVVHVEEAPEGEEAYETLAEARKGRDPGTAIRKIDTGPLRGRKLAVALFNRQGFAEKYEEIQ